MKKNLRPYWVGCAVLATLVVLSGPMQAGPAPAPGVLRVEATVEAHGVRIEARATAPFEYTTYRPSDNLFVVDLAGVSSGMPTGARVLKSEVVSSYRVLQYRAGDKAIVRLEVLMRTPVEPRVERQGPAALTVTFEAAGAPPTAKTAEPAAPRAAGPDTSATRIYNVEVTRVAEQTQVRVQGNGRLTHQALRLKNPDRLVLDFAGTRLNTTQKTMPVLLAPVRGVRLGQFKPDVARVVIDLETGVPHSISAEGSSLTVIFGSPALAQGSAETETATAKAEPTTAPAEPAAPVVEETPNKATSLPENLTQPNAGLAAPAPPKARTEAPAPPPAAPTAVAPQAPTKYTGEPIAVNLKDVDLKDFFRLIHEISGLNVVLDPTVRGTLTIVLDDVPWDQALDIVLKNNGLDKQLEGNVLRIATRDTLKKEAETTRDLAKAQAEAVDQVTATRVLSYAKATALRDTFKRFLSSRGEILADERSNTLIIRDIPAVLPDIDNLIRQLDRKTQQVEIEARVVAATRTFAREIGTLFGFATTSTSGRSIYGGLVGNANFVSPIERGMGLPAPPLVSAGTNAIPLNTNLGAVAPTSGASFSHSSPNFALDFVISAAESKGVGKLLSKPKVITQNNEKAVVKQGTKIPIQTVINNTISTQFIDAVLKLEVTPQITAEGTIFMEVLVENTAIDPGIPRVQGVPALRTQSAETKVLIGDGGTVVIGGVIITEQRTDVAQVPLFGSIPLLGHLFKRTTVSSTSQELLFFMTPRIVPN